MPSRRLQLVPGVPNKKTSQSLQDGYTVRDSLRSECVPYPTKIGGKAKGAVETLGKEQNDCLKFP